MTWIGRRLMQINIHIEAEMINDQDWNSIIDVQ